MMNSVVTNGAKLCALQHDTPIALRCFSCDGVGAQVVMLFLPGCASMRLVRNFYPDEFRDQLALLDGEEA